MYLFSFIILSMGRFGEKMSLENQEIISKLNAFLELAERTLEEYSPENGDFDETMVTLVNIGRETLSIQEVFVKTYCQDTKLKDELLARIDEKRTILEGGIKEADQKRTGL